ncbi:MAG: MFS transporter [Candidatus Limnocylindrales bacterium]
MSDDTQAPDQTRPLGADFWKVLGASGASNLADGIFQIALPLIAVTLTDSPLVVAGVAIAGRLPWLVFVLFAGAIADRVDRRRTMRNVQVARVIVVGALAALAVTGGLEIWMLYVVAFVLGVGETLFDTAAQSLVPNIVRPDQLSRANGRLFAVELVMNQFVGPPLGGVLVGISIPLALGGSILGYALAALGLALIAGSFRAKREGPRVGIMREIAEGWRFVVGDRLLRTLAIMVGVMNLASNAVWAVFVLYALDPGPMGLSEAGFGILITTLAVGSVIASLLTPRLEARYGPGRVVWGAVILTGLGLAVPAFTSNVLLVGGSFLVTGFAAVSWNIITVSFRQRITPDALLGRMNATYRLFAWGTQPLGALLGGIVAEMFGLTAVFVLAAALVGVLVLARRIVTDAALRVTDPRVVAPAPGSVTAG